MNEIVAPAVWLMAGASVWFFAGVLPDRFSSGALAALPAALVGALLAGFLLPEPGLPGTNPPGLATLGVAAAGAVLAVAGSLVWAERGGEPPPPAGLSSPPADATESSRG